MVLSLFQVRNIFKKISARIRQGTESKEEPSTEDTEALEDEMEEYNEVVEESEDVDEMANQMNEALSQPIKDDEDEHPIMVCIHWFLTLQKAVFIFNSTKELKVMKLFVKEVTRLRFQRHA